MIGRIWRLLDHGERRRVMGVFPLLVLSAVVELVGVAAVIPFFTLLADPESISGLPVVGRFITAHGPEDLNVLLRIAGIALALALIVANAVVILTNHWLHRFSWSLNHRISSRLLRHVLAQPYSFILSRNSSALANTIIVEVRQLVSSGIQAALQLLTKAVVVVALVGFLVLLDPLLAATAFSVLGLAYGAIFAFSRQYLQRIGREAVRAGAARLQAVSESLGSFKVLKVTTREESALRKYLAPSIRYAEIQATVQSLSTLPRYALEAVAVGGMVIIASLMAGRDGSFASTLPLLGAYAFAGMRLMPAMQQLFGASARLRSSIGPLEAVEAEFAHATEAAGTLGDAAAPQRLAHAITLGELHFRYPEAAVDALADITLSIERGTRLAIVGRTGSGKTTLVDVILGLLGPTSGTVTVDGVPIDERNLRAYRRLFGYVPQDVVLLDDTIRRNIAFGLPDEEIDDEAVREACQQAQIRTLVEDELPAAYDTVVGERGVRLSGGQRQRIAIARALYHRPPVLVLDEATNALDMHTEQQVYEALKSIAADHTVVTVAHRLESVATVDRVVILDAGRIVDAGAPDEVLRRYRGDGRLGARRGGA